MAFQNPKSWRENLAWCLVVLGLLGGWAWSASASSDQGRTPGPPPLYESLGTLHHPITTSVPTAQRYFDQGLRLVFAFNHEEAIYSFEEAARLDSKAAMAYWGTALALGPNINAPREKDQERRAYEAIQRARALAAQVSAAEQAYIEALAVRYSIAADAKPEVLDLAYAEKMKTLAERFPDDPDAATLYAEALMDLHPWDYWTTDGEPKPWAGEIVLALEKVLKRYQDHPGACHFYIHAVEASNHPERALACARRLPSLMPGAGHLVHMPAHIYMRVGQYHEAAERNVQAATVDQKYLDHRHLSGSYPAGYYLHNLHFLWASLLMEGRSGEALRVARDLAAKVRPEDAVKEPWLERFTTAPVLGLVRFGRWEEVLREPEPPAGLPFTRAVWHYARGMAFAAQGRFNQAETERNRLLAAAESLPAGLHVSLNEAAKVLRVADKVLAGEAAARRGDYDKGIGLLKEAVRLEDGLQYNEPPGWYYPVRHSLGAVLLAAGRPAEAEAVYRADLKRNPENGWALMGLAQSLKARQADQEAAKVETRFRQAWARAEVPLTASRF